MMSTPTLTAPKPGTRCDRCSAVYAVHITLPSGGELVLCRHHATKHRAALTQAGATLTEKS